MWLCISDAFLSIVHKDCEPDELLVRARRQGDIQKVFPDAKVKKTVGNDYLFRAVVKREVVGQALANLAMSTQYPNFKNTVRNSALHRAYNGVWHLMAYLQPVAPFARPIRRGKQQSLGL